MDSLKKSFRQNIRYKIVDSIPLLQFNKIVSFAIFKNKLLRLILFFMFMYTFWTDKQLYTYKLSMSTLQECKQNFFKCDFRWVHSSRKSCGRIWRFCMQLRTKILISKWFYIGIFLRLGTWFLETVYPSIIS